MFKRHQDGKIEICCIGFLMALAVGQYEVMGTLSKHPTVQNTGSTYSMIYCPECGERLTPEDFEYRDKDGKFISYRDPY